MVHLAMAGMPAAGHINPTLPVVTELVARGVEVTYFASPEFADRITTAGARFVPYPDGTLGSAEIAKATQSGSSVAVVAAIVRACLDLTPFLVGQLRERPADALMHDSNALWARLAGRTLGVSTISFMTTFLIGTDVVKALTFRENLATIWPTLSGLPDAVRARGELKKAFDAAVIPTSPMIPLNGDLTLFAIPRELQPTDDRIDATCQFVGPTAATTGATATAIDNEFAERLTSPDPIILVSLGTLHSAGDRFLRSCLEAVSDLPVRMILATGAGTDPATLGTLPGNVTSRRSIPQAAVLSRAALFITHGGMNSAMEATAAGVPMIVIPQQPEQLLIGLSLAERGAATVLRHHLSHRDIPTSELRQAVQRVLDNPTMAAASTTAGQAFITGGGAVRAADLIQVHIRTHGNPA